jgi:hypothetical protein
MMHQAEPTDGLPHRLLLHESAAWQTTGGWPPPTGELRCKGKGAGGEVLMRQGQGRWAATSDRPARRSRRHVADRTQPAPSGRGRHPGRRAAAAGGLEAGGSAPPSGPDVPAGPGRRPRRAAAQRPGGSTCAVRTSVLGGVLRRLRPLDVVVVPVLGAVQPPTGGRRDQVGAQGGVASFGRDGVLGLDRARRMRGQRRPATVTRAAACGTRGSAPISATGPAVQTGPKLGREARGRRSGGRGQHRAGAGVVHSPQLALQGAAGGPGCPQDQAHRYLWAKTEAGGEPRLIQTVRGVGYVLRAGCLRLHTGRGHNRPRVLSSWCHSPVLSKLLGFSQPSLSLALLHSQGPTLPCT